MIPYRMNPLGITLVETIPLTLTAQQANSTVTLNATGSPTVSGLHYRLGKSGLWLPYTIGTTITLANVGDSVQFWNSASALSALSAYVQFVTTGSLAGSGNVMSLMNWSDSCSNWCFFSLFRDTDLVTPPVMTGSLAPNCCHSMYLGSQLRTAPKFPQESSMATACFYDMCKDCSSLSGNVVIRSSAFSSYACQSMFQGTAITSLKIDAESLQNYCMAGMNRYCSSLSRIEVNFTSWESIETATRNWVDGVAATGAFIKPAALPEEYGPNRIPEGWTVVNK